MTALFSISRLFQRSLFHPAI